jgi:hypothetical protein
MPEPKSPGYVLVDRIQMLNLAKQSLKEASAYVRTVRENGGESDKLHILTFNLNDNIMLLEREIAETKKGL